MSACTSVDHVYPNGAAGRRPADGTPCFCGRRRWNQDAANYAGPTGRPKPPRLPRVGARVALDGMALVVVEVDRAARMFKTEDGRWREPTEVLR